MSTGKNLQTRDAMNLKTELPNSGMNLAIDLGLPRIHQSQNQKYLKTDFGYFAKDLKAESQKLAAIKDKICQPNSFHNPWLDPKIEVSF